MLSQPIKSSRTGRILEKKSLSSIRVLMEKVEKVYLELPWIWNITSAVKFIHDSYEPTMDRLSRIDRRTILKIVSSGRNRSGWTSNFNNRNFRWNFWITLELLDYQIKSLTVFKVEHWSVLWLFLTSGKE